MSSITFQDYNLDFESQIYDNVFVQNIIDAGFDYELPEKTLELINRISKMVGAPSYIKTPIFHKSKLNRNNHKHNRNRNKNNYDNYNNKHKKQKHKKQKPLTDAEWDNIRSFEETKMQKIRDGIEKDIACITSQLNKLTDDTYELCYGEICDILDKLTDVASHEDMLSVCKNIFEISSSNKFYAHIFAKLLANIIRKYNVMKNVFYKNYNNFMDYFKEFEYIDPDEDYDGFCDLNLRNEKRRAYTSCVAHLVLEDIIPKEEIAKHISSLTEDFYKTIDENNKKYVSEQIIEIISIIMSITYKILKDEEYYNDIILGTVNNIVRLKRRDHPSLSSKCIFKMMDLKDSILKDT